MTRIVLAAASAAALLAFTTPSFAANPLIFVSNEKETEINAKLDKEGDPLVAVFMPCTPNPTTGFLMYVYRSEIVLLDMTIEDGAKLIVSAGLVAPEYKRKVVTKDGAPIEVGLANPAMEKVANIKFK